MGLEAALPGLHSLGLLQGLEGLGEDGGDEGERSSAAAEAPAPRSEVRTPCDDPVLCLLASMY